MDDDDTASSPAAAVTRPPVLQKPARRVPGSFDNAEISPTKDHFPDLFPASSFASSSATPSDALSSTMERPLDLAAAPVIPPPSFGPDSSYADGNTSATSDVGA